MALKFRAVEAAALQLLRPFSTSGVSVFMLHRFRDGELGSDGLSADSLRGILSALRRSRVRISSLLDVVNDIAARRTFDRATAAFTVDDGYRDLETVGAPIFAEFDCPVTAFLTTDVVSGHAWYWWDQIEHAVLGSPRDSIRLELRSGPTDFSLRRPRERQDATERIVEEMKLLPDQERRRLLASLSSLADVDVPGVPPSKYQPISWNSARRLETSGVSFGPHSRSHPILSRVDDESARSEIHGSWDDLRRECTRPVPIFCYPNGTPGSFTARDQRLVQESGMIAAMSYSPERVYPAATGAIDMFRLPRIALPHEPFAGAILAHGLR